MKYTNPVHQVSQTKDGDTTGLVIGLSPTITEEMVVRLAGFDCPETRRLKCRSCGLYTSPHELRMADEATFLTIDFLEVGELYSIRGEKRDSFGRDLCAMFHQIDDVITDLGESLLDAGLATRWPTRWHEVYDPDRNMP